jgi:hypothetical protein
MSQKNSIFENAIKKIPLVGMVLVFFLKADFIFALELNLEVVYPAFSIFGQNFFINNSSNLAEYICYFFGIITNAAFLVTVIIIAFGGIYYLIDYGRGKFESEGKEWLKAGIFGFLLVICSSLIIFTINPNLTTCNLGILSWFNLNYGGGGGGNGGDKAIAFNEIPIGILTENLLTGKMDCYGFDQNGNPIDGEKIVTDEGDEFPGPTYKDHDRIDCLLQLIGGAQKKTEKIAGVNGLSSKIAKLMKQCKCSAATCSPDGSCDDPKSCPDGDCKPPDPPSCRQKTGTTDCCPPNIKNQIEHGKILLPDFCGTIDTTKEYKGLDEFRCPNPNDKPGEVTPCSDLPSFVEKKVLVNEKEIIIIDQEKWKKLNLWQQLQYFKEKLTNNDIVAGLKADIEQLLEAKDLLSKCYLAIPYVDFLKLSQEVKKPDTVMSITSFNDPKTNEDLNVAKYCKGFNYANSSCYKKCDAMCPDANSDALQLFKQCDKNCNVEDKICLKDQEICINNAYISRPCIYGGNPSAQTFETCISSCQNTCVEECKEQFTTCTDPNKSSYEYKFCQSQCNNNSKCILDPNNINKCLVNGQTFVNCTKDITDPGNSEYCIDRAYLCKNGSDEFSGYLDCAIPSNCSTLGVADCITKPECVFDYKKNICLQNYSSSFLYGNLGWQKCPNINSPPPFGSFCYNSTANPKASCGEICPETTKCLSNSKCPYCPCDLGVGKIEYAVPVDSDNSNAGNETYTTSQYTLSGFEMVGPYCNEYSYNDDPLTFYCQTDWWKNPKKEGTDPAPIGSAMIVPKTGEIPVGQTVDASLTWADKMISIYDKDFLTHIEGILEQMKKIGEAKDTDPIKDYCKCNAKFDTDKPICTSDCEYKEDPGPPVTCDCVQTACKGEPCKQIVDYLSDLFNAATRFKTDFIALNNSMLESTERSDIIKKLAYSRKAMNDCSLKSSAYGEDARLLSCTRVEDELIPPINTNRITKNELSTLIELDPYFIIPFNGTTVNGYCYGEQLGKIFRNFLRSPPDKKLTDNWFCAEQYNKNPTTSQ